MIYFVNTCRYYHDKCDRYGRHKSRCTNPQRPILTTSLLAKIWRLFFGQSYDCDTMMGYEGCCPLYEKLTPKPMPKDGE
jgi:hypothetical protein